MERSLLDSISSECGKRVKKIMKTFICEFLTYQLEHLICQACWSVLQYCIEEDILGLKNE